MSDIDDESFTELDNVFMDVDKNDKNYPIRCSKCYEIAILKSAFLEIIYLSLNAIIPT